MNRKRTQAAARARAYELRTVPQRRNRTGGLRRAARILLLGISLLYVLGFVGWRILLLLPRSESIWPLALSTVFASWFYLPLAALLIVALLLWDRRSLLVLLIPLFAFSAEYGRQFLPNWNLSFQAARLEASTPDALQNRMQLRVMTWNMLYTTDGDALFRAEVRSLQPDLVALQEVGWTMGRSLPEWFRTDYPYQQVVNAGSSSSVALLSRYPIIDTPPRDISLMACYCQQITLDVNGVPVTVINAHPTRPHIRMKDPVGLPPLPTGFDTRQQDVLLQILTERVASVTGPLIVTGDLNTTESQPNFRRLLRYVDDSFAEAGWGMGYTYPSSVLKRGNLSLFPLVRIDHILHSPHWRVDSAWTAPLQGSDHQYVVADLVLR